MKIISNFLLPEVFFFSLLVFPFILWAQRKIPTHRTRDADATSHVMGEVFHVTAFCNFYQIIQKFNIRRKVQSSMYLGCWGKITFKKFIMIRCLEIWGCNPNYTIICWTLQILFYFQSTWQSETKSTIILTGTKIYLNKSIIQSPHLQFIFLIHIK